LEETLNDMTVKLFRDYLYYLTVNYLTAYWARHSEERLDVRDISTF